MAKTKKPTGLSISRNGKKFTFSWKIGDKDYGNGQQLQYRLSYWKKGSWSSVSIGTGTKTKTVEIDLTKVYPDKTNYPSSITFRVRGNRKQYKDGKKKVNPGWSDWSDKSFTISKPDKPTLTAALDELLSNVTTFTWNMDTSDTANKYFRDVEWQAILVKDCTQTDGSKLSWKSSTLGWQTNTGTASSSKTITEDSATLALGSYTRWFRVRARGPAGASDWRYAKHVYALPYKAQVSAALAVETDENGFRCTVTWAAASSAANPIDQTTVQYAITVPNAGLACPSGASWTDADISADTGGNDMAVFSVDDTLGPDECLYIRVNTKHDGHITYGKAMLAAVGNLKNPSALSVVTDNVTHKATISATNNSDVPDAFLVVEYMASSDPSGSFICGVIPNGGSSVTVQCPDWSGEDAIAFGVRAVVGSYSAVSRADGASCYAVDERMKSAQTIWDGGAVPAKPASVSATATEIPGTIQVTWAWSWADANGAEISWSDHSDAWESTDEPSTYTIDHIHAAQWNISGLETGLTWYVRVRLLKQIGTDSITYGPWSDPVAIDLSSAPSIPVLSLSPPTITEEGSVVAAWAYSTTDGTQQAYAEICEVEIEDGELVYGDVIAHVETAQHISISAEEAGWTAGTSHGLCVRVVSASGRTSDGWSDPVYVYVAEQLTAAITATSLVNKTVPEDDEDETTRTVLSLTGMPLTVTVQGAGTSGQTIVSVERAEDYQMMRPDDTIVNGHKGEVVAEVVQTGEAQITISADDLLGYLDDGAQYVIHAIVKDGYGQTAEDSKEFEVHWNHQAVVPKAAVQMDQAEYVAFITPIKPDGWQAGDVCDIYRLSTDPPELIVKDGEFGTRYVDPFPAIGEAGGHRIVFKTANGDYITEDGEIAWIDTGYEDFDNLESDYNIIDFNDEQILFVYNTDITNTWAKDFKRTKYLGGSVQGDWNPAVERDASVEMVVLREDQETIMAMRRLAEFPGICHIRTKEGSSFAADIQVKEGVKYSEGHKLASYTLDVSRVESEGYDGVTYEEWKG